jgi:hypothetical protein
MKLDLTAQTITLGNDSPSISLMLGHVDAITFVKAWHKEGWESPMTSGEMIKEAEEEKEHLQQTYGKIYRPWFAPWKRYYRWDVPKNSKGAVPMTVRYW